MKTSRFKCLLMLLILILGFNSFPYSSQENDSHEAGGGRKYITEEERMTRELEIMSMASDKLHEELITTTYSEKILFNKLHHLSFPNAPNNLHTIFMIPIVMSPFAYALTYVEDAGFPVECFRKLSDDRAYILYRTDEGGYAYIFLENTEYTEGKKEWRITHANYVKKSLKKSDFDSIKKFSPVKKVAKIDPGIKASLDNWGDKNKYVSKYYTSHLLEDGLIIIKYEKFMPNVTYKVTSIEYFPDFIVKSIRFGVNDTFNSRILPQDYPR